MEIDIRESGEYGVGAKAKTGIEDIRSEGSPPAALILNGVVGGQRHQVLLVEQVEGDDERTDGVGWIVGGERDGHEEDTEEQRVTGEIPVIERWRFVRHGCCTQTERQRLNVGAGIPRAHPCPNQSCNEGSRGSLSSVTSTNRSGQSESVPGQPRILPARHNRSASETHRSHRLQRPQRLSTDRGTGCFPSVLSRSTLLVGVLNRVYDRVERSLLGIAFDFVFLKKPDGRVAAHLKTASTIVAISDEDRLFDGAVLGAQFQKQVVDAIANELSQTVVIHVS